MFERNTKKVTVPTIETKQVRVPTVTGLKRAVVPALGIAAAIAKDKASDQAGSGKAKALAAGAAAAAAVAPKLADAKDEVLPRVADARDQISDAKDSFVDETLPKIVEAVTAAVSTGAVAKSDAVAKLRDSDAAGRARDAALVLKGDAVVKRKSSGKGFFSTLLGALGVLSIAGALAWYFNNKANAQDDPWARPLADPYVPPTTGRDSTVGTPASTSTTPVTSVAGTTDADQVPATFTPSTGQVDAPADTEIRVVDPNEFDARAAEEKKDL